MSDAAKILMTKAKELDIESEKIFKQGISKLERDLEYSRGQVEMLMDSAILVCDHSEETKTEDYDLHDHGRTKTYFTVVNCAICGKHLRNE
jgi:hypothetical protein